MSSIEDLFDDLINLMKIKRGGHPVLFTNKLSEIRQAEATFQTIAADSGSATATTSTDTFTVTGGDNITTSISGTTLTISTSYGMEYKGVLDASVGSYPSSPEQGDYYVISVAGSISGTSYSIGDWAVYNGASWDKIDNTQSVVVSDIAYNATSWNAVTTIAPSKNAVRDLIESLALNTLPLAASGAIDCNTQNITNVGTVDGIDISTLSTTVSAIAITNMPTAGNNWKVHYTNGSGIMTELALGAAGTVLTSNGAASAPSFQSVSMTVINDVADLQSALDSGGFILLKAGTYNLTATLDIDQNKSVILMGEGYETIIDCNGDREAFNITAADSVVIANLKIDATNHTTLNREAIIINEASDNTVILENLWLLGLVTATKHLTVTSNYNIIRNVIIDTGWGVSEINGDYNTIENCVVSGFSFGSDTLAINGDYNTIYNNKMQVIQVSGNYNNITCNQRIGSAGGNAISVAGDYNTCTGNMCCDGYYGIGLSGSYNTVTGNTCNGNTRAIWLTGTYGGGDYNVVSGNTCCNNDCSRADDNGGIIVDSNADYNIITGNICCNNNNTGAGDNHGILIDANTENENLVMGNICLGNDTDYTDNGTNTFDTDGAAQALNNIV